MSAYRVDIDGRIYEGHWRNPANAVFGAMLKDEIDWRTRINGLAPTAADHSLDCVYGTTYRCNCEAWTALHKAQAAHETMMKKMLIGVEEITDRKVTKKVHRVS